MAGFDALKEFWPKLKNFFAHLKTRRIIISAVIFIVIYALLAAMIVPFRVDIEEGKPSPTTVYAPRDMEDEYATEERLEEAAEEVQEVYTHDPEVLDTALEKVDNFFEKLFTLRGDEEKEEEEKIEALQEFLEEETAEDVLAEALQTSRSNLNDLINRLESLLHEVLAEQGVKAEGLETAKRQVREEISGYIFSVELRRMAEKLVEPLIRPNMIFDPAATAEKIEAAQEEVEPVIIHRGTRIISEGEMVTEEHINRIDAMGLLRGGQADYMTFAGLFLFLLVIFFTVGLFLYYFNYDIYDSPKSLLLLGVIVVIILVFALALSYFSYYLIPVAAAVILVTVLFGYRLAILLNIMLSLLIGMIAPEELNMIIISLIGGLIAIVTVSKLRGRTDLVKAGLYVSIANIVIIATTFLLFENVRMEFDFLREFSYDMAAGVGGGFLSAMIAIGLLPFLESGFGLTTSVTLLELANPNQPLLRQLSMNAPGTYYHSVMVGNLAEAAAEEVNADPLLCRVGAYYHDIGKTTRPHFFVENQFTEENPHQKLSPNLSALVISAHVKTGVEMAQKEGLPAVIQDIIAQHHGTGMISYFYMQALEIDPEEIDEENYRYDGPLPQSKEAAIIMLADVVEAAVRSLSDPSRENVENIVRRMFKDKLNDGQLDECDLTMRELDIIEHKFIYLIFGMYHNRLEYPVSQLKEEMEGRSF